MLRGYSEQLQTNKQSSPDRLENFLETQYQPKFGETETPKRPTTNKKTG